jgi:hypothetical protein
MKKSHILQGIIWIVAGIAAGYLVWWVVPAYFQKPAGPRSTESLSQEAAAMNHGLPAMLDKETELTITESAPGMFIYKYRLLISQCSGLITEASRRVPSPGWWPCRAAARKHGAIFSAEA